MNLTGRVVNGVVVVPLGSALEEGAEVKIETVLPPSSSDPFVQAVQEIVRKRGDQDSGNDYGLPDDLAANHDYYLHGQSRKKNPRVGRWLNGEGKSITLTDQETASEASDLGKMAAGTRGLPADLAANHDHYLHGLPKQ